MSAANAASLTVLIATIGIVIDSTELLLRRGAIARLFAWDVLQTSYPMMIRCPSIAQAIGWVSEDKRFRTFLFLRMGAAVAATAGFAGLWSPAQLATIVVFGCSLLIHLRLTYGLDGSDQMQNVIWGGLSVVAIATSSTLEEIALIFVAAQLLLAYLTSGLAKAVSREWRSGRAMTGILSTEAYGSSFTYATVKVPTVAFFAAWSVILFETVAAPVAFLGTAGLITVIASALVFHAGVAIVMRLNSFFWAFAAPLPSVAFMTTQLT